MDPTADGEPADADRSHRQGRADRHPEAAASWYLDGGASNSFLSQFEVVSDSTMIAGPGDVASVASRNRSCSRQPRNRAPVSGC